MDTKMNCRNYRIVVRGERRGKWGSGRWLGRKGRFRGIRRGGGCENGCQEYKKSCVIASMTIIGVKVIFSGSRNPIIKVSSLNKQYLLTYMAIGSKI